MKKIVSIVLCLVLLCGVVGCTNRSNDVEKTVVISDINGDEVEIPQNPEKIVCRSGNGTSFVVGMGHSDKLVGTADYVLTNPWISVFMDNSEQTSKIGSREFYFLYPIVNGIRGKRIGKVRSPIEFEMTYLKDFFEKP